MSVQTLEREARGIRQRSIPVPATDDVVSVPAEEQPDLDAQGPAADLVRVYLNGIGKTALLTAEEEVDLAKRIEAGVFAQHMLDTSDDLSPERREELTAIVRDGENAKNHLLQANLRLVVSLAKRYTGRGMPLLDLIQEGNLGLIRAVEKFDWRKGFKFSTYGTLWIRQAIQRGLENSSRTIRLPVHVNQRLRTIARTERELATLLGRDPTDEEVAEAADIPIDEVLEARKAAQPVTSLDLGVGDDGETALGDLLPSDEPGPAEAVAGDERENAVADAVRELPDAERRVLEMRFGLAGEAPTTLAQAGRTIGVSAERARQIEEGALRRLARDGRLGALREAA